MYPKVGLNLLRSIISLATKGELKAITLHLMKMPLRLHSLTAHSLPQLEPNWLFRSLFVHFSIRFVKNRYSSVLTRCDSHLQIISIARKDTYVSYVVKNQGNICPLFTCTQISLIHLSNVS